MKPTIDSVSTVSISDYKGTTFSKVYSDDNKIISAEVIHHQLKNKLEKGLIDQPLYDKAVEQLDSLVKAEGSRGGKIIGHTTSGKPIYDSVNHPDHKKFTGADHNDAAEKNHQMGTNVNKNRGPGLAAATYFERARKHKAKWREAASSKGGSDKPGRKMHDSGDHDDYEVFKGEELQKGGEGSHGGKVIGHTKSGKAIYENANHSKHKDFTVEDHDEAIEAHQKPRDEYHRSSDFSDEGKAKNDHHYEQQKQHIAAKNGLVSKRENDQKKKQVDHHNRMADFHKTMLDHIKKYKEDKATSYGSQATQDHIQEAEHHHQKQLEYHDDQLTTHALDATINLSKEKGTFGQYRGSK